jgi:hypothetical protein
VQGCYQQLTHSLRRQARNWRGFHAALANVAHLKLVHLAIFSLVVDLFQIHRLA